MQPLLEFIDLINKKNAVDDSYWEGKRELSETDFAPNFGANFKIDCAVMPLSRSQGSIASGRYFV